MNPDLMKAILAMDSYNRGYNAGIKLGTLSDNSDSAINGVTRLGQATVYRSKGDQEAIDIGFYAIAYEYQGEVIISYRGTDDGLDQVCFARRCSNPADAGFFNACFG